MSLFKQSTRSFRQFFTNRIVIFLCIYVVPLQLFAQQKCETITEPTELAKIRKDAMIMGQNGPAWLFVQPATIRCDQVETGKVLCTTSDATSAVTYLNKKLISGIRLSGVGESQFSYSQDGQMRCESIPGIKSAKKAPKSDPCNIISDTLTVIQMRQESVPLFEFSGALLLVRAGSPDCEVNGDQVICLTDNTAELVLDSPGNPVKAIEAFGTETVEMTFYANGNLQCAAKSELDRYR